MPEGQVGQSPATRNRTRDHLIAARFYSQMLYQLSYSRLACWPMQFTLAEHAAVNPSTRPRPATSSDAYLALQASPTLDEGRCAIIDKGSRERISASTLWVAKPSTDRAAPGIEPGTSRTLSENHATRPSSQLAQVDPAKLIELEQDGMHLLT